MAHEPAYPSTKIADMAGAAPAMPVDAPDLAMPDLRRQWQQPLGDVHVRLGNIVGSGALRVQFDCADTDFVFELTSHWPISNDFTASVYEVDILKLADALNELVRLYAIETGSERMHVRLEARRGKFELPGWWKGAPVLFATYAFDTSFAEIGLFGNHADAYEDMDLLTQPHRLLMMIGPATPEMVEVDGDAAWVNPDEERLRSLKRWNQQLALQINTLMADLDSGGEYAMEAMVGALSRVRDLSMRLSSQILKLEKRTYRPTGKIGDDLAAELYDGARLSGRPGSRMQRQNAQMMETAREAELATTLADLKGALTQESRNTNIAPAMRQTLQRGLRAINTIEATLSPEAALSALAPARQMKVAKEKKVSVALEGLGKMMKRAGKKREREAAFGALAAAPKIRKIASTKRKKIERKPPVPKPQQIVPDANELLLKQQRKRQLAAGPSPSGI